MLVIPVVPIGQLFFFSASLGMRVGVLCPMLTSQLFISGPAPCKGSVTPFAYTQLQLVYEQMKKESTALLLSKWRIK